MQSDTNESPGQWRDCCCHLRTSTLVAAIIQLIFGIVMICLCFVTFTTAISGIFWLITGILTILGIKNLQQTYLLVAIVLHSINLILNSIGAIIMIAAVAAIATYGTSSLSSVYSKSSVGSAVAGIVIYILLYLSLNIWFLCVTVKCRRYVTDRHLILCSGRGYMLQSNVSGPVRFIQSHPVTHTIYTAPTTTYVQPQQAPPPPYPPQQPMAPPYPTAPYPPQQPPYPDNQNTSGAPQNLNITVTMPPRQ